LFNKTFYHYHLHFARENFSSMSQARKPIRLTGKANFTSFCHSSQYFLIQGHRSKKRAGVNGFFVIFCRKQKNKSFDMLDASNVVKNKAGVFSPG